MQFLNCQKFMYINSKQSKIIKIIMIKIKIINFFLQMFNNLFTKPTTKMKSI